MEVLRTEDLAVGYGKKIVINGVSFSVSAGETVTVIGSNGCGKSTLLKSAAAQLAPLGGTVYIGGALQSQLSERQISEKLSVMLTERLRSELMTCREVVESGRYPYTGALGILSRADRSKVSEAMELLGVTELADTDFGRVSDGQRQRVMLARAVCQEPELLILDEPTTFLDIRYKLEILDMLRRLARERGIGVLMSLHELDLAQKISDKLVCVKDGRIECIGSPEEIFTDGHIRELFGMSAGSYSTLYGSQEFPAAIGEPELFVIGGGGAGISVYRRLQRKNIPFAAGVIHENDIEMPAAGLLASALITEKAFEPIGRKAFEKAAEIMEKCRGVICACESFGAMNEANRSLRERAEAAGILISGV